MTVTAEIASPRSCAWSRATLSILGVELIASAVPDALRPAPGDAPPLVSTDAVELDLVWTSTHGN